MADWLGLYARTVLFWVYPLRWRGERRRRADLARDRSGLVGELVMEPHGVGWSGRTMQLARLLRPGTNEELLPSMVECRVLGIRRTIVISGYEQVMTGRKSVDRYAQTWLCANAPIPPIEWAVHPGPRPSPTGFHPSDDDAA